jgi:hypothetical protein
MKITKNIIFFYNENRFKYLNKIIDETNNYQYETDIFIHTNNIFSKDLLNTYNNGNINIIYYNLSENVFLLENPYYFPWVTRGFMKNQKNDYDIFIYIEDDILVPKNTINYWVDYKDKLLKENYNLGFIRIELDQSGNEYTPDLGIPPDNSFKPVLNKKIIIDNEDYIINNINPYCAFWIYDKNEFNRFVDSIFYDPVNIIGYEPRETIAIGLHGKNTNWYKNTVLPLKNNKLTSSCKIYNLPNNYINEFDSNNKDVYDPKSWKPQLFTEILKL